MWLDWHKELGDWQRQAAFADQESVRSSHDLSTCIVYQDFTQVQVQGTFFQDCIQAVYWVDGEGELQHQFYHFIAATVEEKHDDAFVYEVWQYQLQRMYYIFCLFLLVVEI